MQQEQHEQHDLQEPHTKPAKEIRAQCFILTDAEGRDRAFLSAEADGPGFGINDENGTPRLLLSVTGGNCSVTVLDATGAPRIAMMALSNGDAGLWFYDPDGKPCALPVPEAVRDFEQQAEVRASPGMDEARAVLDSGAASTMSVNGSLAPTVAITPPPTPPE